MGIRVGKKMKQAVTTGAVALVVALAMSGCGPRSMEARIARGETASDRAYFAVNESERALAEGDLKKAQEQLRVAENAVDDPDMETSPEEDMLKDKIVEIRGRLPKLLEAQSTKNA